MTPDHLAPEFAGVGRRVRIFEHALILRHASIVIDDDVRIDAFSRIEGGIFTWIGERTHIASFSSILGGGECIIGKYCAIAQGVRIITGVGHPDYQSFPIVPPSDDYMHPKQGRVVIGDYAFIGANAIILPHVTIGEGAVISAGSLIARDVPEWSIVAGCPARAVGTRRNWMNHPTD